MSEIFHSKIAMRIGGVNPSWRSRFRRSEVGASRSPSEKNEVSNLPMVKCTLFISELFHVCVSPNQTLEPTATLGGFDDAKISIFMSASSSTVSPVAVAHL